MSIQDEINRLNQNVSNAYSALEDMGATLPTEQNSANIANAIRSIPQSGGGGGCTFAISGVLSLDAIGQPIMTINEAVTAEEVLEAFNSNKYMYMKCDVSILNEKGGTSYVNAPMTQLVTVPSWHGEWTMIFDFIMGVNGVPHNITVGCETGGAAGNTWGVTMTPLA